MFWVKKLVSLMTYPLAPLLIVGALGALLIWRGRTKWGQNLMIGSFAGLILVSTGVVGDLMLRPLESRYAPLERVDALEAPVNYVVVLGGGLRDVAGPPSSELTESTAMRLLEGIRILQSLDDEALLVVSGAATGQRRATAEVMAALAIEMGVPSERVLVHDEARDTSEEAQALAAIASLDTSIVLVTEASHMPRSMKIFERQGFAPKAAPTYFQASARIFTFGNLWPSARNLRKVERALYEYVALVWVSVGGS